ncbi:MAG: PAS domain S-box protein, partial [Alphaproteobacteria bacterium]|nr:PAS domain S-box protein [Alphaproteobacteria bacterium]
MVRQQPLQKLVRASMMQTEMHGDGKGRSSIISRGCSSMTCRRAYPIRTERSRPIPCLVKPGEICHDRDRANHPKRRINLRLVRPRGCRLTGMKDSSDWSAVVDCVAASVLIFDKTGRLISSNPAARDRLGTLGRIAEPNQFAAILAPTAEDDANQVLAALGANKSPQVFTALVADRAGQERPMRWTVARAIFSGSAAILVATGHDQPLENEIPRSESLDLRAIIDAVPVPIVLTRVSDGTIRYVNQATSQRIGITTEQFIGRRSPDFYANPAQRSEILARIKRDGHVDAIEIEFKDHTGRTFPALLSSCVMPIQGEAVLLSCIYDIAELKATERARSDSEARYRILAEKAQVGIVHLDASWNCTYANPAACRMLEVAEMPQIVGRSMIEFSTPESVPTIVQHRERRIRGESSSYEIDIVGSRGGRRSLLVSAAPLLGADGTLVGSLATYTDITELKDTHRALVRASERAEAASRA